MEENVTNENEEIVETPVENTEPTENEEENPQLEALKGRIPYDEVIFGSQENYEYVLGTLLEDSKYIALSEIYPFKDFYDMDLPRKYLNWQLRCCVELYNLGDKNGIISYSENGLSWTRESGKLSKSLMGELTRKVGVPRSEEELDV